ncbi:MAG: single-stranded-DNA-specific exonuclease RecJ [Clostridia bacterium]|nr:single-stranded-DNA-specific exonuclease RecJ [Clostridia bacterium]
MKRNTVKKWNVHSTHEDIINDAVALEISRTLQLSLPCAELLVGRGCTNAEEAKKFLGKGSEILHDPFLMKDMRAGAERVICAIKNKERIVIYGDYDVDGVTSVSILYLYLQALGVDVHYYIPCRKGGGYGVSRSAVDKLIEDGTELVVTVDTGITANEEILYAKEKGVEFVVTDHHECRAEIPEACAVINPKQEDCPYPFKELAGVGVVFKFLCAMECLLHPEDPAIDCVRRISYEYADLAAIGTIADVMPIKDENRLIVSLGLSRMENTKRVGLSELINLSRNGDGKSKPSAIKKITSGFIGFTIAPRINAAGRISDASIAVELFLTDERKKAIELASRLCDINRERQVEENKIAEEAHEKIAADGSSDHAVIVLDDEKWHHGIIGIVSSRVTEKHGCPSILISFEGGDDGTGDDVGKGSGRSIAGMNLVEALNYCSDLLVKYGGHELAAGLTIKRSNLPEFRRRINEYAKTCFSEGKPDPIMEIDCELIPEDVTMRFAEELFMLEPYGISNPVPQFVMYGMTVGDVVPVGAGRHTKIHLGRDHLSVVAMYFGISPAELGLGTGDRVDVLFNLDINEFRGIKSLQFIVRDIRLSEEERIANQAEQELYERIKNGEALGEADEIVPTRDEFAAVYNFLRREFRAARDTMSLPQIVRMLSWQNCSIGYVKLKFIIRIFQELNLVGIDEECEDVYRFSITYTKNKTSLDKSNIYRRLKSQYSKHQ